MAGNNGSQPPDLEQILRTLAALPPLPPVGQSTQPQQAPQQLWQSGEGLKSIQEPATLSHAALVPSQESVTSDRSFGESTLPGSHWYEASFAGHQAAPRRRVNIGPGSSRSNSSILGSGARGRDTVHETALGTTFGAGHGAEQEHSRPGQAYPPSTPASLPTRDSSTITEWKHAVRYINKVTQSPTFENAVKELIHEQERNIKDWDMGRKNLAKEQERKRQDEIAERQVTPAHRRDVLKRTIEVEKAEMKEYLEKVHRASLQMEKSQAERLRTLGVPFFNFQENLLLPDSSEPSNAGRLTKAELRELKIQMLKYLNDLFED